MNDIKTCIITGAAGFIGSHLTEKCLEMGWYVYGMDKLSYCSNPILMEDLKRKYPKQFKFEHIDINDVKHIPDIDILFNICAESHVDNSIADSDEFIHSNINGVHHLLEIVRHKKHRPLFYQMSTDEIYGDCIDGSHKETDNYKPSNPYSFSKASADLLVQSYGRTYGIQYKIGRATNTWGIRQNSEKLIPRTCQSLKLGRKIPLHNYGYPTRTWLHVNDCVNGILTIVNHGFMNEIYNIGGNFECKNWKIVAKIANLMGIVEQTTTFISQDSNSKGTSSGDGKVVAHNIGIDEREGNYFSYPTTPGHMNCNLGGLCDFSYTRDGQDVRYSLDDSKLQSLGWKCQKEFDKELPSIVKYYTDNFIW